MEAPLTRKVGRLENKVTQLLGLALVPIFLVKRSSLDPLAELEKGREADKSPDREEAKDPFPARLRACGCNLHREVMSGRKTTISD